jgi:hypothetical protein
VPLAVNTPAIRRSQTISPFGVGAIFSFGGASFVADDIVNWKTGVGDELELPRLARALGVNSLKQAPAAPTNDRPAAGIPFTRFPSWLFCQKCRLMARARDGAKGTRCSTCRIELTPMRWVLVCENGHLDDVDWRYWAHSRVANSESQTCRSSDGLHFRKVGRGGGLDSLAIACDLCKSSRNLGDLMNAYPGKCRGVQPWNRKGEDELCKAEPRVLQRGASNVHFAVTVSAIDIPPHSNWRDLERDAQAVLQHSSAKTWRSVAGHEAVKNFLEEQIATACDVSPDRVRDILATQGAIGGDLEETEDASDLLLGEWQAFVTPRDSQDPRDRFVTRHETEGLRQLATMPLGEEVSAVVDRLVMVTRLREVRALKGFSRITHSTAEPGFVRLGRPHRTDWLPAIELNGEGIFVALSEEKLRAWESLPAVVNRCDLLASRLEDSGGEWLAEPTPRFVLLHTLAHLLIRQLAFDSGYSSSSVRERVYAASAPTELAGVLLYTAASDSEGTLGGLARQGDPHRFTELLVRAIEHAAWCSSDPVCGESSGQGRNLLNLAACHACTLLSETSCDYSNCLLDRSLLVGHDTGFFDNLAAASLQSLRVEAP